MDILCKDWNQGTIMHSIEIGDVVPFAKAASAWALNVTGDDPPRLCDEATDLLSVGLHWLGLTGLQRMTSYIPNSSGGNQQDGHVWLLWNNLIAIDATTGQFPRDFPGENFVVRHSDWHLELEEKRPPETVNDAKVWELRRTHSRAHTYFARLLSKHGIDLESDLITEDRPIMVWKPVGRP